jgi:hypothetical protein
MSKKKKTRNRIWFDSEKELDAFLAGLSYAGKYGDIDYSVAGCKDKLWYVEPKKYGDKRPVVPKHFGLGIKD